MQGVAAEKIPGGKLLRMKVDYNDKINSVKITGDFFMHPEESVVELENVLINTPKNEDEQTISFRLSEVVQKNQIELIGIDTNAIARVLKQAMK